MSYFSLFKIRSFSAFVLTAAFCFGAIAGHAQSLPDARQIVGAVDPLLDDYKTLRQGSFNPLGNRPSGDVSLTQTETLSPTGGELDASFNVGIDSYPGNVRSTVLQPDGKILVAGYFRTVNAVRHKSIVRVNADYSLDSTFSANVNGTILAVALQPDGKIIIGGAFLAVSGASRNRIARLNADGSLDTTFNPGIGVDGIVYDVAVQTDGKVLLGGSFFGVNSTNSYAVARLNADGAVDASFVSPIPAPVPSPNPPFQIPSIVYSLAIQPDGKIVIAGYIIKSYANSPPAAAPVARLNPNGAFDLSFNPGSINSNALKVVLQPDGKILLAGFFTLINQDRRNFIARFNTDGSLDLSFNTGTGANFPVNSIFVRADGKILIIGRFTNVNNIARSGIAQLNADGSLDNSFVPPNTFAFGSPQSVIVLPSGKVFVGGSFGGFNFASDSIKILNPDGSADT